jgi:hypothetical protein
VLDEKRSGRPQTSEDEAGRIQQATEQSPHASICRLSNQLDIPKTIIWRVLQLKQKNECITFNYVTTSIKLFGVRG